MEQTPLFVNPNDVIERMALDSTLAGVTTAVSSAIQAAQLKVESILSSKLTMEAQNSLYFLDSDAFSGLQPGGMYRLELPSGFIRQDSPITLTFDTNWNMPNVQTVVSGDPSYMVDYLRGYILMDAQTYGDKFVRVQCTTGFNGSVPTPQFVGTPVTYNNGNTYYPGDTVNIGGLIFLCVATTTGNLPPNTAYWQAVTFGPEIIPDHIYEAIMNFVPSIFDSSVVSNRDSQSTVQYTKASAFANSLLEKSIRMGKGFCFRPVA